MGARLLVLQPSDGDPPEGLGEWLACAGADLVLRRPAIDGVPESLDGVDGVRVGTARYGVQSHIETSPTTVLSWARRDPAGAALISPGQFDPDHFEQVHADMAEVWGPLASRFVALAAGQLAVVGSGALGPGERPAPPLLGH